MWDAVVDARWWARGRGKPSATASASASAPPTRCYALLCSAFAMPVRCWYQNHIQNQSGACTAQPLGGYRNQFARQSRQTDRQKF